MKRWRNPWLRGLLGAIAGYVVALVVAVNVAIFGGAEQGYETPITELMRSRPLLAVVVIVLLIAGPVIGAWIVVRSPGRSSGRARRRPPGTPAALR